MKKKINSFFLYKNLYKIYFNNINFIIIILFILRNTNKIIEKLKLLIAKNIN